MKTVCMKVKKTSLKKILIRISTNSLNLHPYCYEPEKDASESSGSDSDTNEDERSLRNGVLFGLAWVARLVCLRGWCGWNASVDSVGGVLA